MKPAAKVIFGFIFLSASLSFVACQNGSQNLVPVGGYGVTSCVAGQVCATSCVPGQLGCTVGLVEYMGNIGSLNSSVAKQMIQAYFGTSNWCLGGCYNDSTVEVSINGTNASVTLDLGGYPITGQGTILAINGGVGTDIQVYPFGTAAGRIDIISNSIPLTGTVGTIPSVPVEYNGQVLGNTSLILE